MKIYVIRHGITKSNKLRILNGQAIDEGIEENGIPQIKEAMNMLPEDISKIYSSNMIRTRQTADIINERFNVEISFCPELREVDFGIFSGKSFEEVREMADEGTWVAYRNQEYDFTPYKGESFNSVKERVLKIIDEIKKNHADNEKIVIVTHGGIIRFLNHYYKGVHQDGALNASINEFEI